MDVWDFLGGFSVFQYAVGAVVLWFTLRLFVLPSRPVSYPGEARELQLDQTGEWRDAEARFAPGWKFLEAEASHAVTEKEFGTVLLGEAAGRQSWVFDAALAKKADPEAFTFNPAKNVNSSDKVFRSQRIAAWKGPVPNEAKKPADAAAAADKAMEFYQMLQCDDGHWAGDYGGPMFLMPGLIFTCYIGGVELGGRKPAMIHYLRNHQQADGGWGLHIEGPSTMFGSCMNYVAVRLLGVPASDPMAVRARTFIQGHGGGVMCASWGKFWLACLGLYEWEGINSIPAEMWLLPNWFPFHPGRLWCHCRMVYLPMCYLFCTRFKLDAASNPLLMELRQELYPQGYDTVNWDAERHSCAAIDEYSTITWIMKFAHKVLAIYERRPWQWLRKKGTDFAIAYIHAEDKQTNFIDIGPVNKSLNMLCVFAAAGADSKQFQQHVSRIDDYLWVAEDGMKMQGYNGSQCWDTSFLVQAANEAGLSKSPKYHNSMARAYSYFDRTQIRCDEDQREYWYRHISKGGWPFSTAAHGWPIVDCTAEALKGVLALHDQDYLSDEQRIPDQRLFDSINVILSYQNPDGGWATYENNRGYGWFEALNPSEVFGDIMIDYSYVELTSAAMTALSQFLAKPQFASHRAAEIRSAIKRGAGFIKAIQRPDGSWYGSWAICFTYGTWFGIEALTAAGEDPSTSPSIQRAVAFLLSKQNQNGGWGESFLSCVNKAYPADGSGGFGTDGSAVVQTAWALLALLAGQCKDKKAVAAGVNFLMKKQLKNGDWPQEGITGVFNRSCGITYTQYRNVFPIWALGRYANYISD